VTTNKKSKVLFLRIDHAIIMLAIVFVAVSMYLLGLSLQEADLSLRAQLLTYVTVFFLLGVLLIILLAIVSISKRLSKPT